MTWISLPRGDDRRPADVVVSPPRSVDIVGAALTAAFAKPAPLLPGEWTRALRELDRID